MNSQIKNLEKCLLWLCGIHGEVVKNAVKVACIAISIKAMLNEVLTQTTLSKQKIFINQPRSKKMGITK